MEKPLAPPYVQADGKSPYMVPLSSNSSYTPLSSNSGYTPLSADSGYAPFLTTAGEDDKEPPAYQIAVGPARSSSTSSTNAAVGIICCSILTAIVIAVLWYTVGNINNGANSPADPTSSPVSSSRTAYVITHNTKAQWMQQMATSFNKGSSSQVSITVDSNITEYLGWATAWSPANYLWVEQVDMSGTPLFNNSIAYTTMYASECTSVAMTPLGIAMWKKMATALGYPQKQLGWKDIITLAATDNVWTASYNQPWGSFKFAHGHPVYSNSGRLTLIATINAANGNTTSLTQSSVSSAIPILKSLERSIVHLGSNDLDLLNRMVLRGPNYLHAVATYESNVIKYNTQNASSMIDDTLVFIYPYDGTFWSEHPYCTLTGTSAYTPSSGSISESFKAYLTTTSAQTQLVQTGLRPMRSMQATLDVRTVAGTPFTTANGVDPNFELGSVPIIPYPPASVMTAIVNNWTQFKKPAVVTMLVENSQQLHSGAMSSYYLTVSYAVQTFISMMSDTDYLYFYTYSSTTNQILPPGDNYLLSATRNFYYYQTNQVLTSTPTDSGSALFDAVGQVVSSTTTLQSQNNAKGLSNMLYAVVVVSDGIDSGSKNYSLATLLQALPSGTDPNQVHVYTIALGNNVYSNSLYSIAAQTNGQFFSMSLRSSYHTTSNTISDAFNQIVSEF